MDAGMAAAETELKLASTALPVMRPPGPGLARILSVTPAAALRQAASMAQELDAHSSGAAEACDGSGAAQPSAQQQPVAADNSGGAGGGGGSSPAASQAPVQQEQHAAVGAVLPEDAPTETQQPAGPGVQLELTPEARWGATEGHFAEVLQDFLVRSAGSWQKINILPNFTTGMAGPATSSLPLLGHCFLPKLLTHVGRCQPAHTCLRGSAPSAR